MAASAGTLIRREGPIVQHTCMLFQYCPLEPGGLLASMDSCKPGQHVIDFRQLCNVVSREGDIQKAGQSHTSTHYLVYTWMNNSAKNLHMHAK
eukprot:1145149-Pelagomonas_calceolata.AAC.1